MNGNYYENNSYPQQQEDTDYFNKSLSDTLKHRVSIDKHATTNQHLYKIEILVPHFQPNDIQVKLNEKKLNIQARRFVPNSAKNVGNLRESEFFERDIELPDFILIHTANCYLEQYKNEQNILVIEAVINEKYKDCDLNEETKPQHTETGFGNAKKLKYINYALPTNFFLMII